MPEPTVSKPSAPSVISTASKPPLRAAGDQNSAVAAEKSVISNAGSTSARGSSQNRQKKDLLKSDILSKEEEARITREKREKMEEIK